MEQLIFSNNYFSRSISCSKLSAGMNGQDMHVAVDDAFCTALYTEVQGYDAIFEGSMF